MTRRPTPVLAAGFAILIAANLGAAAHAQDEGAPPDGGAPPPAEAQPAEGQPAESQPPADGQPAEGQPPAEGETAPPAAGTTGGEEGVEGGPPVLSKSFSGVWGRVTDGKTGEGLIEAQIRVVSPPGIKKIALTNIDGYYKLKLKPGEYELRISYDVYKPRRISNIVIEKGTQQQLDIQLAPDEKAVTEVIVQAKQDRRKAQVLLQERKKAAVVQDALSAQEIARSPDTSANDAVKRIPSATVVDGRYLLIRGLGGRYSLTLLNRTFLPSPEPDEPSIPLDLFPTALLANINLIKTYDADLPSNFSGGAMLIETNSYPTEFEVKAQFRLEYNSEATFRRIRTYPGGSADWLGYDDGTRALPREVPRNAPVADPPLNRDQITRAGQAFNEVWVPRTRLGIPNMALTVSVGGTKQLKNNQRLGYLATINYSHREEVRQGIVANGRLDGINPDGTPNVGLREEADSVLGRESARLGALVNVGYQRGNHDINLFSLYAHNGDKEAQSLAGFSANELSNFEATRLRFIQRDLSYSQLRGEHKFLKAHNLELTWQVNFAYTARNEPDTRDMLRLVFDTGPRFRTNPQSGERFFSTLNEISIGGSLDFVVPWKRFKLRMGAMAQYWTRRFDARRLRYFHIGTDTSVLLLPVEELFADQRIGTDFELREQTLQNDGYDGRMTLGAGYLAGELNVPAPLRIIAGLRYEVARQELVPGTRFSTVAPMEQGTDRLDSNFAPAANLVYALTDRMNLRAAYSYTVARPRFRELASFGYFDFDRRRPLSGNPNLQTTTIHNIDARWEWFLRNGGVLAASVFYKYFNLPIEQVVRSTSDGAVSFENAGFAHLAGLELEARTDLAFLHRKAKPLYLGLNISYIWSQVTARPDQPGSFTSRERPLQGQAPYVVNLQFGYANEKSGIEVFALYNVFGENIVEVGIEGLPDIYQQPWHRLDLTLVQRLHKQVRLKIAATNLAYQELVLKQGNAVLRNYQPGVGAFAQVEWSPF